MCKSKMADISSERLRKKIKGILRDADLSTLSAKKVRLKLQSEFDTDLSDRKKEIDQMTMSLIMEMEEKKKKEESEEEKEEEEEEEEQNGNDQSESEEEEEELPKKKSKTKDSPKKKSKRNEDEPPKKKSKTNKSKIKEEDLVPLENDDLNVYDEEQKTLKLSDEELAKRLQAFEESGRRTRGRVAPKRKEKKKGASGTSVYSRPCNLSPDLAALMGTDRLARNEVVKKMWEIVKERKLQDPKDKRFMICDEQLMRIFGKRRIQTFGMMKYLSPHIRGDDSSSLEAVITNSDIYDDEADDDD